MPNHCKDTFTQSLRCSNGSERGFVALISTILLTTGVLTFAVVTLASAVTYSDMVMRRELRIQAGLNLVACLDSIELMIARDHYLSGTTTLPEFGCIGTVKNTFDGHFDIEATALMGGVEVIGSRIK